MNDKPKDKIYGMAPKQYSQNFIEDVSPPIMANDFKEPNIVVYGLVGKSSNSWKSPNPNSGCYEADTARTLDTNGADATCNQGGNIVIYPEKARTLTARADSSPCLDRGQNIVAVYENLQQDDRITEVGKIAPTVAAKYGTGGNNTPLVAYSLDRAAYNQGQNAQFDISIQEDKAQTLVAKGPHAVAQPYTVGNGQPDNLYLDEKARTLNCMHDQQIAITPDETRYIVRRLTPLECCRLQGYPDYWAKDLELTGIHEKHLTRWAKKDKRVPKRIRKLLNKWIVIFETHRQAVAPEKKAKTRNQIVKWLKNPHSNSAEYKMWGNSLAIPCAYTVLAGIAEEIREEENRALTIKEQKALVRIEEAFNISEQMGKTLIVAYSGGKDSDVLLDLAIKTGVPFEVQHNHTTADAPETVYHIRAVFKRLTEQGISCKINYPPEIENADGKRARATMWNLIPQKQIPPTRLARYCCEYFKEHVFEGQHIMTGVRWDESHARKQRGVHETLAKKKENRVVYFDEDDDRHKMTEICHLRNRVATNPIIDWTDEEIWDYIERNGITTNPLYAQGFKRVGCIGCPMAGEKGQLREFEVFPKYRALYIKAFEKMLEYRNKRGLLTNWTDGENVMRWWTDRSYDPNQMSLEDFEKGILNDE